ncbi:MAG: IS66 family transposase [Pseudomonadota bacterium]|nr:IS66 family transposase [Pseudomonadota bacterium]
MPSAAVKSSIALPEIALPALGLPAILPGDVAGLTALLHEQHSMYASAVESIRQQAMRAAHDYLIRMVEQAALARHRLYGASSEQTSSQARLFDEAEVLAQDGTAQDLAAVPPVADPGTKSTNKKARGKRTPLPANLQRVDVVHDVPADERTCPCGTPMVEIGEEVSEQLDVVPMQVRVLRHVRKRYGCPGSAHAPVTALLPPQPLPKSNASFRLLAMLLVAKFVDGLPLARFEYVLGRHGTPVPRQTLARWVIGASAVLQPLHNLLRDLLLDGALIHMDETVVQVLKEKDKAATSNSYMWVQTGGPPGRPVVLYDYDPSRSGEVPARLLEGYQGYLMTDGYEGYNRVARTDGVEHMVCWAHARRGFVEAARVQPKGKRGKADEAVDLIGQLYGIERAQRDATDGQRLLARQTHSVHVLAQLRAWLETHLPAVPTRTALGAAMAYLHKYWGKLTRYIERGDLPIDNNRCENAIRPFVVGRKGWLFSDTPAGAHASAVIYSLVQTAKANGVEPYQWLCHVLRDLPAAKTVDDVEVLLPWNIGAESDRQVGLAGVAP